MNPGNNHYYLQKLWDGKLMLFYNGGIGPIISEIFSIE